MGGRPVRVGRGSGRVGARPRVEALESRLVLSTFTITSLGDDAATEGTLRWAITQANATEGEDTIAFQITGAGQQVIQPASALPTITDKVFIDGGTQGDSPTPLIVLDGTNAGAGANGLTFGAASPRTSTGSSVRALGIVNFADAGIRIGEAPDSITVTRSFLGIDPTTQAAQPNRIGVAIVDSASHLIGGADQAQRNVISGNTEAGIAIRGAGATLTTIQANRIGTNADGTSSVPNGVGILIGGTAEATSGARGNIIGGAVAAARNLISGNTGAGIRIVDAGAQNNRIEGNYIGTNLAGAAALANAVGVEVAAGASTNSVGGTAQTLRNLIAGNTVADVRIDGAGSNRVSGNFIGTRSDGLGAIPGASADGIGVLIQNDALDNTVGGTTATAANVIAGLGGAGVVIRGRTGPEAANVARGNTVRANLIGVALGGITAVPNRVGILLEAGAIQNVIGGLGSENRNVISGNTEDGVRIVGASNTNTLQNNLIGLASDATAALPNGRDGVRIDGADGTTIGGTVAGAPNTIALNTGAGVHVLSGTGNRIERNSIYQNGARGIVLGTDGGTPNDPLDPDTGPNNLQNAPTLQTASTGGGSIVVTGTLNSTPNQTFTVDIYTDPIPDPSGAGEGRRYLASVQVTTDANGVGSFTATAATSPAVPDGQAISALAIASNGDTSEFAANIANAQLSTDLGISKVATRDGQPLAATEVPTGGYLTYTIFVTNHGPSAAPGVTVTDPLPTGVTFVGGTTTQGALSQSGSTITIALGTLEPGATATITLTIVAPATIPSTPSLANTATVAIGPGVTDTNASNNTSTATTTVVAGVNLRVSQVATPDPARIGSDFAFIVTVTNASTTRATNVTLNQALPAGVTFVSASTSQGTVGESGGVITANLGDLPGGTGTVTAGAAAQIIIVVRPAAEGNVTTTATASATQLQNLAGANVSALTLVVGPATVAPVVLPPTVEAVSSAGANRVAIRFSDPLDRVSATRIRNYLLAKPGPDGRFNTRDDQVIRLRSARLDQTGTTVTLTAARNFGFRRTGLVVVGMAPDGVRGTSGEFLAGGFGGTEPGTNYATVLGRRRRV